MAGFVFFAGCLGTGRVRAEYRVDFDGEGETKSSYASGGVWLGDVEWWLREALIGNHSSDKVEGVRALRMRRTGTIPGLAEMLNDKPYGLGTVSFLYAGFGSDTGQPALIVEYSDDGGDEWHAVGDPVTNFPSTLTVWSQEVNVASNVRVRLRTDMSGYSDRKFNVDSLVLTDYGPTQDVPVVVTRGVEDIGPDRAVARGEVVADNGSAVSERGFLVAPENVPGAPDLQIVAGEEGGEFAAEAPGLFSGGAYTVRAYAVNAFGTGIGQVVAFEASGFTNAPVLELDGEKTASGFGVAWTPAVGAFAYQVQLAADDTFNPGGEGTACAESFGVFEGESRAISTYDAAGGFDNSGVLTFGDGGADNPAEIRITSSSKDYTNGLGEAASGGANVYFRASTATNTYGFAMEGIDVQGMGDFQFGFAYRKEKVDANAGFTVAFRVDESGEWHPVAVNGFPEEDAGTGWVWLGPYDLGSAVEDAETLSLRWVNTNTVPLRIDDVLLWGDCGEKSLIADEILPGAVSRARRFENLGRGEYHVRVRAVGAGDSRGEYSNSLRVEVSGGGLLILR